jgi:major cell surface glycoprotein (TIGR04216 family)
MTGYLSDEVRAVVLSALMVLSVMVGSVAFAGTAAATSFNGTPSISPTTVDDNQAVSHTVDISGTYATDGTDDSLVITVSPEGEITDASGLSVSVTGPGSSNVTAGSLSLSNNNGGTNNQATLPLADADSSGVNEDYTVNVTGTVEVTWDDVSSDTSTTVNNAVFLDGSNTGSSGVDVTFTVNDASGPGGATRAGPGGSGSFDTADGEGVVYDGATVYQGEEDINFAGTLSQTLTGVSGDAEGQVLEPPIPQDQTVGRYSTDGQSGSPGVTVQTPRVTSFDVNNVNGEDIAGGSVGKINADLTVVADYNYNNAEDLEITVEEEGGLDITDDVVNQSTDNAAGEVFYSVDLTEQDAGTYTISVAGSDDLDFGQASQSTTVEVTSQDNVGIEVGSDTVTQGDNVQFDVTGGIAGDLHLVQISSNDFREDRSTDDYASIFRNVADVEERGVVDDSDNYFERGEAGGVAADDVTAAYAIVEIDDGDGLGTGSIDTTNLDTVSVTVDVSDNLTAADASNVGTSGSITPSVVGTDAESTDDVDFDVEEGDVTLDSPGQTYVVGSEVDVNGTAPEGMDNVAIYVRDEGDFEHVEIDGDAVLSVDADGTFEETDVRISQSADNFDGEGNQILSLPGSYRIGVIDASDANIETSGSGSNGNGPDGELTTQEFNQGTSSQRSIRVIGTSLDAQFPSLIRGQIAEPDNDVTVNGSAPGSSEVLFIVVGPRGNTFTQQVSVDSDQTFEEEDIALSGISKGAVSLHVYSVGRDDRVGDGDLPGQPSTLNGFENYVANNLSSQSLTGDQVRSSILSETVEDSASDDQLVNQNARLVDAQSNIVNVYQSGNEASGINPVAAGETLVLEGRTNLQPDDNTITVELGNEDTTVGLASTEEWGSNGEFMIEIDTADAATGTYTLEVDDGENTVTEEVELVESISTPTPTPTEADDTPTATDSPTPTATASPTPTEMPDTETASPTPTEGGGPGFGAVVALVALLAAALLATRRDN